jgi:hypothetical protein
LTPERLKELRLRAVESLDYGEDMLDLIEEVERLQSICAWTNVLDTEEAGVLAALIKNPPPAGDALKAILGRAR